jgi:hypothetical protein
MIDDNIIIVNEVKTLIFAGHKKITYEAIKQ